MVTTSGVQALVVSFKRKKTEWIRVYTSSFANRSLVAFRCRTQHSFQEEPAFYQLLYTESGFVMRGYLVPSISLDRACPCRRVRSLLARDLRGTPISVGSHPNLVIASSWALSIFLYSIHKEHGMNLQVSSITSSSSTPAGVRPSLISFSSLVISARLLAFLISASNLAFSFSFSLTFGCLEAPFASGAM